MFGRTEDGLLVFVTKDPDGIYAREVKAFNDNIDDRIVTIDNKCYEVVDIQNGYYLDLLEEEGYVYPAGITFEGNFDNWHNDENTIFYFLKEVKDVA